MAIMDDTLREIVAQIEGQARDAGLARTRGGLARSVAWAEISGRNADGDWVELRLHHHYRVGKLQGGMLIYHSLTHGGRTEVVGECTLEPGTVDAPAELISQVTMWIDNMREREGGCMDAPARQSP
jgi:hypothetical protein